MGVLQVPVAYIVDVSGNHMDGRTFNSLLIQLCSRADNIYDVKDGSTYMTMTGTDTAITRRYIE